MTCECYAVITDPERAARFAGIFPDDHIPIRHPLLAGRTRTVRNEQPEEYDFLEVAIERFTLEQKRRVAEAVAQAGFRDVTVDEVLRDMENPKMIIPLRADGVTVATCDRHTRAIAAAAMDDADLRDEGGWCPEP